MKSPYRVLIADDEIPILKLSSIILNNMGMEVVTASDGDMALEKIKIHPPDLIISDIFMPKKTGFDICRALQLNPKWNHIPILLLSALGDSIETLPGYFNGHQQYLSKPFQVTEFQNAISQLIQNISSDHPPQKPAKTNPLAHIGSGISQLDNALHGGFKRGSNWLIRGPVGSGKSQFTQQFLCKGLLNKEPCFLISLDDNETELRRSLNQFLINPIEEFESQQLFQLLCGITDLNTFVMRPSIDQLIDRISDLESELGQTISEQSGGRRVFDSMNSLFAYFNHETVFSLIQYLCKTGTHSGQVSTLFIWDIDPNQPEHRFDHIFDGILESKCENQHYYLRISSAKWGIQASDWILCPE